MENSKLKLIFPYFFIFIFILASISQKCPKNGSKLFVHRFASKLPYNRILIRRIQKSNLFSHIFSASSSFLPRLVKNGLKNESKLFSHIFMKISVQSNIDMENSKIKLIFPNFFIYIFIFALISQNCHKK